MKDSTEERSLPPTPKKLLEARKKGQIVHSFDMVAGVTTSAVLLVLWSSTDDLTARLGIAFTRFAEATLLPFQQATGTVSGVLADSVRPFAAKLVLVSVGGSVLANLIIARGFLFTLEPVKPRLDNLNPVSGLKRMFALRGFLELIKSLIKTVLLVGFCVGTALLGLNAVLRAPVCELTCVGPLFAAMIRPLLVIAVIVLLCAGMIDIVVQRWLFQRQMRMTPSELKRERKDQEGIPEIRTAQRRGRQELMQSSQLGVDAATLFIEGEEVVVGLRYVRGETPVPRLVCKGRGIRGRHLLALGQDAGTPKVSDAELAAVLDRRVEPGNFITEEFFNPVAKALHVAATQSAT
jgi:type III secretion protein U